MAPDNLSRVDMFHGRPHDQVGIVVRDLKRALELHNSLLGGEPWRCFRYGPDTVPDLTYRGRTGGYSMTIAINEFVPQVELIQPHEGPSIYHEWLEEHPEGLHHLGFWVESLADAVTAMASAGYDVIQSGAGYGLDGDGGYAYFDTIRDFAVILEAIEIPKRRREPDYVFPP